MITQQTKTILGDIPDDWGVIRLRDAITDHLPGQWGEEIGEHLFRVLRSTNLTNDGPLDLSNVAVRAIRKAEGEALQPRKHDILLERSGGGPDQPVGRVGFIAEDMPAFAYSNFIQLLRPDPAKLAPGYLGWALYYLNRSGRVLRLEQQTTGMRNLMFRDYLTIQLPNPRKGEDAAIARVLDAVEAAIERTRLVVTAARRVKRGLVQALLTRGIGPDGVIRDPAAQPEDFQNSPLGQLPKSWTVQPLSAIAEVNRGKFTPRPRNDPRYYGGPFPFIQTGDVTRADSEDGILRHHSQTLNEEGIAVSREFPKGTVMITIVGANIGTTAVLDRPMYCTDSVVGIQARGSHDPFFLRPGLWRIPVSFVVKL